MERLKVKTRYDWYPFSFRVVRSPFQDSSSLGCRIAYLSLMPFNVSVKSTELESAHNVSRL